MLQNLIKSIVCVQIENRKMVFQVCRLITKFVDLTLQSFFSKFLNNIVFISSFDTNYLNFQKQLDGKITDRDRKIF